MLDALNVHLEAKGNPKLLVRFAIVPHILASAKKNDRILGKIWLRTYARNASPIVIKKTGNVPITCRIKTPRLCAGKRTPTAYVAMRKGIDDRNIGAHTFHTTSK
jgi:hypothetical protein